MNETINIRPFSLNDLKQVTAIHLSAMPPTEWSKQLGGFFVTLFFKEVLRSEHASCFVAEIDQKIVAYAVAFTDYPRFNRVFVRKHFIPIGIIALSKLLTGKFGFKTFLDMTQEETKGKCVADARPHLGSIARMKHIHKTTGHEAIDRLVDAIHRHLLNAGFHTAWCSCDERNEPMKRVLMRHQYTLKGNSPCRLRTISIFEKNLTRQLP